MNRSPQLLMHILTLVLSMGLCCLAPGALAAPTQTGEIDTHVTITILPQPLTGVDAEIVVQVFPSDVTGTLDINIANPRVVTLGPGATVRVPYHGSSCGTRGIVANYSGDAEHEPSAAGVNLRFPCPGTSIELTSCAPPAIEGMPCSLTVHVTPPEARGIVRFFDGNAGIGSDSLRNGVARLSYIVPGTGPRALRATLESNESWEGSTAQLSLPVFPRGVSTMALTSSSNPGNLGDTVRITATVFPAIAEGNVVFKLDEVQLALVPVVNGVASFSHVLAPCCELHFSAAYSGDGQFAPSSATLMQQIDNPGFTRLSLSSGPNPASRGETVRFIARITPAQTPGRVQFSLNNSVVGSAVLTNGTATFDYAIPNVAPAITNLTMTAIYEGSGIYSRATAVMLQGILPPPALPDSGSRVVISASPQPLTGLDVDLTIQVFPPGVTGTLDINVANPRIVTLGPDATVRVRYHAPHCGTRGIVANYSGDASHEPSAAGVNLHFPCPATSLTLSASPNPAGAGTYCVLSAAISPPSLTGTIRFFDGNTSIGTAPIVNGVATFTYVVPYYAVTRELSATFAANADWEGSSAQLSLPVITRGATAMGIVSSRNPGAIGDTVRITARVTPLAASGNVTFLADGLPLAIRPLVNGDATCDYILTSCCSHSITASYSGNANYNPNAASYIQFVTDPGATTMSLEASANPAVRGQPVRLTARLTPVFAPGSVSFYANGAFLGSAILASGTAGIDYTVPDLGPDAAQISLTAHYEGSGIYNAAYASLTLYVPDSRVTTLRLTSSANPAGRGQSVVYTARVFPDSATGSVDFSTGSGFVGTVQVVAGVATIGYTIPNSSELYGFTVTADYSGATNFFPSGMTIQQQVNPHAATSTALTSDVNPSSPREMIVLTATVTPPVQTGLVWFYDGAEQLGTAYVIDGVATLSTTALDAGTHALAAAYGGSAGYAFSRSPVYSQEVISQTSATLTVIAPAGGEEFFVGAPLTLQWNSASVDSVPTVSLFVARNLPEPDWTPIAFDVPNTGSYTWTVLGPGTNTGSQPIYSAQFAVMDLTGLVGSGATDAPSAITDPGAALTRGGGPVADSTQSPIAAVAAAPEAFAINRVWPNPSPQSISVAFALPRPAPVRLAILDLQGREVALLASGTETAGVHRASWDGRIDGRRARAGLYFARYTTPDGSFTRRISLLGSAGR